MTTILCDSTDLQRLSIPEYEDRVPSARLLFFGRMPRVDDGGQARPVPPGFASKGQLCRLGEDDLGTP